MTIAIGDGYDYIGATDRRFDLILVDGYDAKCRVGMLDTLPFLLNCRAHLRERGLLATNFLNRHRGIEACLERMGKAFDGRACALPVGESGNVIGIAAAGEPIAVPLVGLTSGALRMKRDTGLNLLPMVSRLLRLQAGISDRFEL